MAEVEKAAEKTADVSTFEKFIKPEPEPDPPKVKFSEANEVRTIPARGADDDDDIDDDLGDDDFDDDFDDDLGDDPPAKLSDDDEKNIRLIRNYRKEFGDSIQAPSEDELAEMSSRQLAAEVDRIRNDVSGGVTVEQVKGIYFTGVSLIEQTGPTYGAELYGLTDSLRSNATVDTCLRAATCELKAQITNALPWWAMLPATTAIACVQVHAMNKAERGTREYFSRVVKDEPSRQEAEGGTGGIGEIC